MERKTQIRNTATALFSSVAGRVKDLATLALILNLGIAAAHADSKSVKMIFSGTNAPSAINLQQPGTNTSEDSFAGEGTLGSFTVRNVRAMENSLGTSSTCSGPNLLFFVEPVGASVLRFQDGSLLEMNLTQGGDCIDLTTGLAHCTLTFQIIGGTGRFQHASGVLTMSETAGAVENDALGNPVFFVGTGEFTGKISGLPREENWQDRKEQ